MEYENWITFKAEIKSRAYDNKFIVWVPKETWEDGYTLTWYIDSVHDTFVNASKRLKTIV